MIGAMPSHPNIIAPKNILVTAKATTEDSEDRRICGSLTPFLESGSLHSQIENANSVGNTLPLPMKANWCLQMASAINHTHSEGRTYHMEIKPSNMLLDSNHNLLVID